MSGRSRVNDFVDSSLTRAHLQTFVVDAVPIIADAQKNGNKILVEGAQAVMLDLSTPARCSVYVRHLADT